MDKTEKKLMHYMSRAIADYNMLQNGDRVLVCLSGGKDSYTMLQLLHKIRRRSKVTFELFAFTLDQRQPGWDDSAMRTWLQQHNYPYEILQKDTYSVVLEKVEEGKTYCSLCSRLRRGNIYGYAKRNGFNKIALGHHRDDLIESMLMSILYNGVVRSMPPKFLNDDKKHIVVRPMSYCQETDIQRYSEQQRFPIIPCNLCGSQENLTRQRVKKLIADLAAHNPKIPSNILGAIGNIQPSQLMDASLWDFKELEKDLQPLDANFEEPPKTKTG